MKSYISDIIKEKYQICLYFSWFYYSIGVDFFRLYYPDENDITVKIFFIKGVDIRLPFITIKLQYHYSSETKKMLKRMEKSIK